MFILRPVARVCVGGARGDLHWARGDLFESEFSVSFGPTDQALGFGIGPS